MIPKPGSRVSLEIFGKFRWKNIKGVRAKIGFLQTGEPEGLTISEFNKGGKGGSPKKSPKKKAPPKKKPQPKTKQGKLNQMNKKIDKMASKWKCFKLDHQIRCLGLIRD